MKIKTQTKTRISNLFIHKKVMLYTHSKKANKSSLTLQTKKKKKFQSQKKAYKLFNLNLNL